MVELTNTLGGRFSISHSHHLGQGFPETIPPPDRLPGSPAPLWLLGTVKH